MANVSVDDKLGFDKFNTDEKNPHITVKENWGREDDIRRLVMACPAGLYRYEDGKVIFSHEGCLECGTCRVLSGGKVVESWRYPDGGMGVEFRQG